VDPAQTALGDARTLALTRLVAGLIIACSADVHTAASFAGLDAQLVTPPVGLGLLRWLALSPMQAQALTWTVVVLAVLGAVGAYARIAFSALSLALLVLLALPQRLGAVSHVHHLLWVATLLAASPCADVWSVDAYFEPRPLGARARYALPLDVLRALLACIYFFPGLHKLLSFLGGVNPGDWLRSHVAWKWLQHGSAPPLLRALPAALFTPLALAALAFELSFPALVAARRARPWLLLATLAFHAGTTLLLFIRFESLAVLWVSLIDLGPAPPEPEPIALRWRAGLRSTRVVGAGLLAGAVIAGALGLTQLYPFACYPTFAAPAPASMPSARIVLAHGQQRCALPRPQGNAQWVEAFRIAGAYGDALDAARAEAYLRHAFRTQAAHTACRVTRDTQLWLVLEQLSWDFDKQHSRVLSERVVYAVGASKLGIAPAGTNAASIAPSR
jgi:hypothetical protein